MKSKTIQNFLQVSGAYLGLEVSALALNLGMQSEAESVHEGDLLPCMVAKHMPSAKYAHNSRGMQSCKAIF